MSARLIQGNDDAAAQKAAKLYLSSASAYLRDHRGGNPWNNSAFQKGSVVGPHAPVAAVRRDEHCRVIDDVAHAERRVRTLRRAPPTSTRRRASSISLSVSCPCCASHSWTAARPSWRRRARRAASVIHAEMLIPRAAAAAST